MYFHTYFSGRKSESKRNKVICKWLQEMSLGARWLVLPRNRLNRWVSWKQDLWHRSSTTDSADMTRYTGSKVSDFLFLPLNINSWIMNTLMIPSQVLIEVLMKKAARGISFWFSRTWIRPIHTNKQWKW